MCTYVGTVTHWRIVEFGGKYNRKLSIWSFKYLTKIKLCLYFKRKSMAYFFFLLFGGIKIFWSREVPFGSLRCFCRRHDGDGLVFWHINHCGLFNAKSSLYIYIKYIWLSLVGFCCIWTIVGYLMPNPFITYILNIYDLVWLGFYGISTIVGYLMPNPLYTYILNIYDLVWLGLMAYQPMLVV